MKTRILLLFASLFLFSSNFAFAQLEDVTIEFDKEIYTWTDKITIKIIAHDFNTSHEKIDIIGDTDSSISISSKNHFISDIQIPENRPTSGIFVKEILLSGFLHDADGDVSTGDKNGNDVFGGDHVDLGAAIGDYLIVDDDDIVTVTFTTNEGNSELYSVESSVVVSWNIGKVLLEKKSYQANNSAKIQVTDSDMNWNPNEIDRFSIDAWSDSDPAGITLTVRETGKNTGIFESLAYFSNESSMGQRLHTIEGDSVIVEYEDHTLPSPYTPADELGIKDRTIIRNPPPQYDSDGNFIRMQDPDFKPQDFRGETISNPTVIILIQSLGAILIVFFIILYAIKKRMKKSIEEKK